MPSSKEKESEKPKSNKKSNKYKKTKSKSKKRMPFESSSDVFGMSVSGAIKEDNSNSIQDINDQGSDLE